MSIYAKKSLNFIIIIIDDFIDEYCPSLNLSTDLLTNLL